MKAMIEGSLRGRKYGDDGHDESDMAANQDLL
jgi:hypothetical protein